VPAAVATETSVFNHWIRQIRRPPPLQVIGRQPDRSRTPREDPPRTS
jgi:hypothetical protein